MVLGFISWINKLNGLDYNFGAHMIEKNNSWWELTKCNHCVKAFNCAFLQEGHTKVFHTHLGVKILEWNGLIFTHHLRITYKWEKKFVMIYRYKWVQINDSLGALW